MEETLQENEIVFLIHIKQRLASARKHCCSLQLQLRLPGTFWAFPGLLLPSMVSVVALAREGGHPPGEREEEAQCPGEAAGGDAADQEQAWERSSSLG